MPTESESAKLELIYKIAGLNGIFETDVRNSEHTESSQGESGRHSKTSVWLSSLEYCARMKVDEGGKGSRDNLMFNPQVLKDISRLCKLLPMWSAAAASIFNATDKTASSAYVESYFKNVKQCMMDSLPCSADTFVQRHIDFNNGAMKIASVKYIEPSTSEQMPQTVDSSMNNISDPGSFNHVDLTQTEPVIDNQSERIVESEFEGMAELQSGPIVENQMNVSSDTSMDVSATPATSEINETEKWSRKKHKKQFLS